MANNAEPLRRAVLDARMQASLSELTPLLYAGGELREHDVLAHVRAASALRRHRGRLVIVQDDVSVLALREEGAHAEAILLPAGPGEARTFDESRGNKHAKMDLEACAALPDGRLVAFGSGSTAARERLVVMTDGAVRLVDAKALYARLRSEPAFAGSELNVEGALVVDEMLKLFQRGNGAPSETVTAVNACCDLPLTPFVAWLDDCTTLPSLQNIVQYDLGQLGSVPFTFTDAALMADGRIAFIACAEASPDTIRDGEVLGSRFGIIDGDQVRITTVCHSDGRPTQLKLEGIESRPDSDRAFDVVIDMDRGDQPALLGKLVLREQP